MTNDEILIGLAELPDLAPPLQAAGLSPISGDDLRGVATDIRRAIESGREVAVLAMQTTTMGLHPFLTRVAATPAARAHPVVILRRAGADPLPVPGAVCMELPASLAEIVAEARIDLTATEYTKLAGVIVAEDGTAHAAPAAAPDAGDDDDWLSVPQEGGQPAPSADGDPWAWQDEEPEPAAPATTPEMPTPVAARHGDDPWGPAPETAPPARPDRHADAAPSRQPAWHETPTVTPPQPPASDTHPDRPVSGGYRPDTAGPAEIRAALSDTAPTDLFTQPGAGFDHTTSPDRFAPARRGGLAPVVFTMSGKGGTGKTSMAINVAQRAASSGSNLRVVLVDMNRGQGDVRRYLRIARDANPRCVVDAAYSGNPADAILAPRELVAMRHHTLEPIRFALALAPPRQQSDPRLASADVYLSIINFARREADLVVVDTQIIEGTDTSGLIDRIVTPTLATDGWGMGVSDTSTPGVENLKDALVEFQRHGAARDRILTLVNRAEIEFDQDAMAASFAPYSFASFCVTEQSEIVDATNSGQFVHSSSGFAPPIDTLLYRILALPEFDPARNDSARRARGKRRRWGRRGK